MGDAEKDEGTLSDNPESAAVARGPSRPLLLQADLSNASESLAELRDDASGDPQNSGGLDPAQTDGSAATQSGVSAGAEDVPWAHSPDPNAESTESTGWTVPPPDAAPEPVTDMPQALPEVQSTNGVLDGGSPAAETCRFADPGDASGPVGHEETKPFGIIVSEPSEAATEAAAIDAGLSTAAIGAMPHVRAIPIDDSVASATNDSATNDPVTNDSVTPDDETRPYPFADESVTASAGSESTGSASAPNAGAPAEVLESHLAAAAVAAVAVESADELLRYRHTAVTPKADGLSGFEREPQPTVSGRTLRSKPPPKPANYRSEPPLASEIQAMQGAAVGSDLAEKVQTHVPSFGDSGHQAPSPSQANAEDLASPELSAAVNSIAPVEAVPRRDAPGPSQGRKSKLPMVFWGLSLVVVFMMGLAFGSPTSDVTVKVEAEQKARVAAARAEAFEQGKAAQQPPLPVFDLSAPKGAKAPELSEKASPPARTRLDAIALGRYWSQQRFDAVTQVTAQLKRQPQRLADEKVRAEVLKYVSDRATSRLMLETLAELGTVPALDILYDVWIGSKDRNESTQLAEALLLASDVRPHASKALELALLLREKPTDCGVIASVVETAIREGDRRSAMQLVNMGARVNCGATGDQDCIKCLAEPKDLRKAVHASVSRPAPL